jgi:heme-degrading monooxygenase HmoA
VFARSSTINAQASMIDAGIAHVRDTVMPAMTHIDGFVGLSLMVDRASGRCIATSAWRTEEAMRDSADRAGAIRDDASAAFGGTAEVEQWEVAVLHRAHHARPGACMRATWSKADPARITEAMDVFKFSTLAQIEDLPGFCSASLLVNRADGRVVVTVAYDSRDTLERSREAGSAVREEAAREADMEVLDVAEFDLEVAHLHVPETV